MYNLKYLKYKNKYLELKQNINNHIIGGTLEAPSVSSSVRNIYFNTNNEITNEGRKCLWLFFSKLIYHAVVLFNIYYNNDTLVDDIVKSLEDFIILDETNNIFKNLIDINCNIDFSIHDINFTEYNHYLIMSGLDIVFNPIGKTFTNTENTLYTIYYGKDIDESSYENICTTLYVMLCCLWNMYGEKSYLNFNFILITLLETLGIDKTQIINPTIIFNTNTTNNQFIISCNINYGNRIEHTIRFNLCKIIKPTDELSTIKSYKMRTLSSHYSNQIYYYTVLYVEEQLTKPTKQTEPTELTLTIEEQATGTQPLLTNSVLEFTFSEYQCAGVIEIATEYIKNFGLFPIHIIKTKGALIYMDLGLQYIYDSLNISELPNDYNREIINIMISQLSNIQNFDYGCLNEKEFITFYRYIIKHKDNIKKNTYSKLIQLLFMYCQKFLINHSVTTIDSIFMIISKYLMKYYYYYITNNVISKNLIYEGGFLNFLSFNLHDSNESNITGITLYNYKMSCGFTVIDLFNNKSEFYMKQKHTLNTMKTEIDIINDIKDTELPPPPPPPKCKSPPSIPGSSVTTPKKPPIPGSSVATSKSPPISGGSDVIVKSPPPMPETSYIIKSPPPMPRSSYIIKSPPPITGSASYIVKSAPPIRYISQELENMLIYEGRELLCVLIILYINDSSKINKLVLVKSYDVNILPPKYYIKLSITIFDYLCCFRYISHILSLSLSKPIGGYNPFTVYSVSQLSLFEFQGLKNSTYTFPIIKSTTFSKNYCDHIKFISCDILPVIFEIEIDPNELTNGEFMFLNSYQYEVILPFPSTVSITDITTTDISFKTGKFNSLNKNNNIDSNDQFEIKCIVIKSKLNKFNFSITQNGGDPPNVKPKQTNTKIEESKDSLPSNKDDYIKYYDELLSKNKIPIYHDINHTHKPPLINKKRETTFNFHPSKR